MNASKISKPKRGWIELFLGPVRFRSFLDNGVYLKTTPLQELVKNFQHPDGGILSVEEDTGAIFIQWNFFLPDGRHVSSSVKLFGDQPSPAGLKVVDEARANGHAGNMASPVIPAMLSLAARNLFCEAVSLRSRLTQEFMFAVDAGLCRVFARVDSPIADFNEIAADVFRHYRIARWGYGVKGGGFAELNGAPPLYAIHLEPANLSTANAKAQTQRIATDADFKELKRAFDGSVPDWRKSDDWRKVNRSNISRDSFQEGWRILNPNRRRGPRGPRNNSSR